MNMMQAPLSQPMGSAMITRETFQPRAKLGAATQVDIKRAGVIVAGVTCALGLLFYSIVRSNNSAAALSDVEFGRDSRTGSIMFMPIVGDACRQNAFDNDSGALWQAETVSCLQALGFWNTYSEEGTRASNMKVIGEKFRK
jgi:hypothetical protein